MLDSNKKYPYPLLRETAEDYMSSVFSDDLEILREDKGFRIVPRFSVNNEQISALICSGVLSYAIQIQCRSTYYRTVEYVQDNKDFLIPSGLVHELVELCPCIIAMQDIDTYTVDDMLSLFKQIPVSIYKNDVVGIGSVIRFHAYYKADEVKKASSVITVNGDSNLDRIKIELNKPNIQVYLPQSQYDAYLRIGTNTADQVTLLTGIISVPVIARALYEIDIDDDSEYSELAWYKSLKAVNFKLAEGDPAKISNMLENLLQTAQQMLGDNLSESLAILDDREW